MRWLRRLAVPHMLWCVLLLVLGVVLILKGVAGLGVILVLLGCFAAMAWVLRMDRPDGGRTGRRRSG